MGLPPGPLGPTPRVNSTRRRWPSKSYPSLACTASSASLKNKYFSCFLNFFLQETILFTFTLRRIILTNHEIMIIEIWLKNKNRKKDLPRIVKLDERIEWASAPFDVDHADLAISENKFSLENLKMNNAYFGNIFFLENYNSPTCQKRPRRPSHGCPKASCQRRSSFQKKCGPSFRPLNANVWIGWTGNSEN